MNASVLAPMVVAGTRGRAQRGDVVPLCAGVVPGVELEPAARPGGLGEQGQQPMFERTVLSGLLGEAL
jgi:hypothetical protein